MRNSLSVKAGKYIRRKPIGKKVSTQIMSLRKCAAHVAT